MMRGLVVVLSVIATLLPGWLNSVATATSTTTIPTPLGQAEIIKGLESNLLALFGFQRRPHPDRLKSLVPQAMMHLYNEQYDQDLDTATLPLPGKHTASANTVRTFTHTVSAIDSKFSMTSNRFRLSFDIASLPVGERLTAAELQLYSDPTKESTYQRVAVHDIVRPGIRGQREPILRLIDSKVVVNSKLGESISFDVMPAVLRWLETNQQNYGLLVEVNGVDGDRHPNNPKHVRLRRNFDEEISSWLPKQPLLFTYTDDGRNVQRKVEEIVSRSKRSKSLSGHQAKKHKRKENCRRHPLYVDFADVGWNDWIVAPQGYEAYYCHGDCPFPLADHLNSTNHAIVQTLVNSVNPAAVPKACCVPTQLTSISMLYLDEENKVVLKNYQDMAVLGCGCR